MQKKKSKNLNKRDGRRVSKKGRKVLTYKEITKTQGKTLYI